LYIITLGITFATQNQLPYSAGEELVSNKHRNRNRDAARGSELLPLVRAFVGPAFVIGGWQVMQFSFWAGLAIVFSGFCLCLAECVWEPVLLRKSYQLQVVLIGIVFFFFTMFTIGVASVPAPVGFSSLLLANTDYPPEAGPGGIPWRSFYTELDFMVINPSDNGYDNVDISVRPDSPVAAIAQLGNLSDVSFEDAFALRQETTIEDVDSHTKLGNMALIATDAGYKVHCGHIPPRNSLRIVMAVVAFKKTPKSNPILPDDLMTQETFTDRDGKFTYWFGTPTNSSLYEPRACPKKIVVSGSYIASYRKRTMKQEVNVLGGCER
jgi:hypothetical protein